MGGTSCERIRELVLSMYTLKERSQSVESEWNDISTDIYCRYYLKYCHHDTSLLSRSKIAALKASIFQQQVEREEARNNVELETGAGPFRGIN